MNILDQLPAPKADLPIRAETPLTEPNAVRPASSATSDQARQPPHRLVSEDFKQSLVDRLDRRQGHRLEERANRALGAYLAVQQDDERAYMERLLGISEFA